jgi:hypothetical protein
VVLETRIWPPCPAEQIRAARWTSSPAYPPGVSVGSPVWMPRRTRTRTSSGQDWSARDRWIVEAAVTASLARLKTQKQASP